MSSANLGLRGFLLLLAIWLCTKLVAYLFRPAGVPTTKLRGPPSPSRILGFTRYAMQAADISVEYEQWAALYGGVFEIPLAFGMKQVMLSDPKALNHCYNTERSIYVRTESERQVISAMFGRGVLWAEGEMHKRQRKALTPAFSNAAIRKLTSVFYDSAYKLKSFWDETIESSSDADSTVIEVQEWMNRVALDSIGIAGFSHDFHYIDGKESPVTAAFHALELTDTSLLTKMIFAVAILFPFLQKIPTERMRTFWRLRKDLATIAGQLLEHTRREKENGIAEEHRDKSIIGLLIKAELTDAELYMTQEEVVAQNVLLLAGYETTSVSLTWALVELSRHPEMQQKLREELTKFGGDPTWDQLSSTSDLPYLDSIVLETLRMHPALKKTPRLASQDDVIPLSTPIVTATGETVSSITVAKGTVIVEPIRAINRSEAFWGPDAKEFNPERWFRDIPLATRELQGYRHLLTFHDGPRTCLGKGFALAEFKAVLSVLIRNYAFEFPRGPDTKIEEHTAIIDRPKVAGEKGAKVPLRVRRL
ncbi:Cytochrome P450 4F12 [Mycena sanguinolenta]|uniref:Cytochrome P450 4F12 n=1 Tax=Mycena sanguinolenta TaxID=230812 RepID=A0A8H7D0G8_9AGAR|nr:Cytochrome P450 4F12 [Mycena sanguinolenta]